ncbi:MAG: folate-binding protein YgfZ [Planctomycetota bacterium]
MSILPSPDDLLTGLCASLGQDSPATLAFGPGSGPGLIEVVGQDAVDFLQRITTADVAALADGEATPLAFLDPKGKLLATAVAGRSADSVILAVPRARFDEVLAWCERYHFTEKLTLRPHVANASRLRLAAGARGLVATGSARMAVDGDSVLLSYARGGLLREWTFRPGSATQVLAPSADEEARLERLRIAAGDVSVGVDTDARTLALEAGLEDHISTTKGCYTGQEIVARVHTYGHVNKRLVRLTIEGSAPIAHGTAVFETALGETVGRVLSSVAVPEADACIAIGMLAEGFLTEPAPLELRGEVSRAVRYADLVPA